MYRFIPFSLWSNCGQVFRITVLGVSQIETRQQKQTAKFAIERMVIMKYCTIKEAANRWGVSEQLVRRYCRQKRIPGLTQENGAWLIPAKAKKPEPLNLSFTIASSW